MSLSTRQVQEKVSSSRGARFWFEVVSGMLIDPARASAHSSGRALLAFGLHVGAFDAEAVAAAFASGFGETIECRKEAEAWCAPVPAERAASGRRARSP